VCGGTESVQMQCGGSLILPCDSFYGSTVRYFLFASEWCGKVDGVERRCVYARESPELPGERLGNCHWPAADAAAVPGAEHSRPDLPLGLDIATAAAAAAAAAFAVQLSSIHFFLLFSFSSFVVVVVVWAHAVA
jgi:hypothetical protein